MPERSQDDPPDGPDPAAGIVADRPALELPASFGKYFLTEKLATGGMAEIYLGKIVGPGGFEKQLVIKQIHPRLSGQRHFVDLFVTEAKILVTLTHGNIVPVYELGVIDDTYFIAMEYIDGPTLYRLTEALRRRGARMAPAIAAWITARIVEGLDYAHRKGDGVIHRDLSPRNVMLSRDGEVKLVDFGIAVALGGAGDDDSGQSAPTGSFPYMSPEQVRKQPLTVQTDLFSVGVLLWEMLVGRRLFARSDPDATLRAVVDGDIARPSVENPEVPARLDDVVMRALERDTAARWATAGDLLDALQRYLYSLDDTPGPRDVAALVARHCPPETRRLPTHHDELDAELAAAAGDSTRPRPWAASPTNSAEAPRPGPATAVIPRDAAEPQGKRPRRARTQTFATHVELEQILERGAPTTAATGPRADGDPDPSAARTDRAEPTPTHARGRADRDDGQAPARADRAEPTPTRPRGRADRDEDLDRARAERADPTPVRPRAMRSAEFPEVASADASAAPSSAATSIADPDAPGAERPVQPTLTLTLPGRSAPSGSLLVIAAIGAIVLGGAAIVVFLQGRGAIDPPDAAPRRDAAHVAIDTVADAQPAPTAAPTDGAAAPDAGVDAAPADADLPAPHPLAIDAGVAAPRHDAGIRPPRPDARAPGDLTPRPDAGTARPTGTATLTVGAIPWGTVLLDGKPIGRTPIDRLTVPAGHHVIQVTFGGEDPPRTQSYTVDLAPGETKDLLADFSRP